jgi:hypothetical protein|tara:strand:+ start:1600 stop:1707 length:108 start_codon:yes stop_codon:yes gene_type:complete
MDVLIPLAIMVLVIALSMRKFKPELWEKAVSKFKK